MENKSQSERAHELAGFVRGFRKDRRHSYFLDWLSERYHMQDELSNDIYDKFADEIESLGEQDGLPYPLDKDGVPCRIYDDVYNIDTGRHYRVKNATIGETNQVKTVVLLADNNTSYRDDPKKYTHKPPRTLDDILQDAPKSCVSCEDDTKILDLIREAYELGKKEAK